MAAAWFDRLLRDLGLEGERDRSIASLLDDREREIGTPLPLTLRRFYETRGLRDSLGSVYSGYVEAPENLGLLATDALPVNLDQPTIKVLTENQGVCIWVVPLRGDDPPVLVGGNLAEGTTIVEYSTTVSEFIYTLAWDCAGLLDLDPLVQAQAPALDEGSLQYMRSRFRELPSTHGWPCPRVYRFERNHVRVLLWSCEGQCDWWITSKDTHELETELVNIAGSVGLREHLWSNDIEGCVLVERVFEE